MSITYDSKEFKVKGTTLVKYTGESEVVTVPEGITTIGGGAFYDCRSITTINLPQSLITIEKYAFLNCFSLKTINLPPNLTTTEDKAFSSCESLTTIYIPRNLKTIGKEAFYNCKSLTTIITHNSHHIKLLKDSGYKGKIIIIPLLIDTTQQNPKYLTPLSTTQIFQ